MKLSGKEAFQLLKKSAKDFGEDECPTSAAALAYSTVFALPPLLILILMLVGAFVSREQVQEAMSGQMGSMVGPDGAKTIQTMLTQAKQPGGGALATIMGIVALVLGATGAFMQLQGALNRAWEVRPDPNAGGLKNFIFKRLLSVGMVLVIAFLLLVSLALSAALTAVGGAVSSLIPGASSVVVGILQTLVSLAVVTLLFSAIFYVLPDAKIAWKDVWVGGLVTAILFEIGKWAIGLYLGNSNPGKAYGAAGSLAVLLVWIYYTAMIVLFGAEFTETWATERGSGIEPEEGAVWREDASGGKGKTGEGEKDSGSSARGGQRESALRREDVSKRAEAAAKKDRAPDSSPGNQSGLPGGGVGRREAVGGSGIHPVSAGTAPKNAETRTPADIADPDAGAGEDDERRR
ncbi:YihY/virulence factor BrkB family protein [Longimicrobium sp.]|uniref:YihY/virulence factor BrkB family protein n=1 Tax=Longimicrobium sp. TaxID=2029185 RepID=UPI002BBAA5FF|nr:YihY/virulence factor BrkB family protein [Longimicrobium sp.]HSU15728.1 YihY/virulence factor BrkB family protein [Longimicrobium sp.]